MKLYFHFSLLTVHIRAGGSYFTLVGLSSMQKHNYVKVEVDSYIMQSMLKLGGLGACPQENFEKLDAL